MSESQSVFNIIFGGDAKGLSAASNTAINEINRVHHTIRAIPTQFLQQFGGWMAGLMSAGAIASNIRQLWHFAESINEVAEKTGVATDKLQAWDYAGKKNGVTLQDWSMALRRIGMAQQQLGKDGTAAKDIESLGIKADAAQKMKRGELLEAIWNRANAGNLTEQQRMAVSRTIGMRGGGEKFFETFGESTADEAMRKAQEDRVIMEKEMIDKLKNLGDEMENVQRQFMFAFINPLKLVSNAVMVLLASFAGLGAAIGALIENFPNIVEELRMGLSSLFANGAATLKSAIGQMLMTLPGMAGVGRALVNSSMNDPAAVAETQKKLMAEAVARGYNPNHLTPGQAARDAYNEVIASIEKPSERHEPDRGDVDSMKFGSLSSGSDAVAKIGGIIGGGAVSMQRLMYDEQKRTTAAVQQVKFSVERNFSLD